MRASIVVCSVVLLLLPLQLSLPLARVLCKPTDTAEETKKEIGTEDEPAESETFQTESDATETTAEPEEAAEANDTETSPKLTDPAEGSRLSTGGAPVGNPPRWLAGAWLQRTIPPPQGLGKLFLEKEKDPKDLFSGFMVRLNDHHVIAHKDTCSRPQNSYYRMPELHKRYAQQQVTLRLGQKIDATDGVPDTKRLFGCDVERGKMLDGDMGVFRLTHEANWDSHDNMLLHSNLNGQRPPIQHDPNVKDNCFLHSYSGNADPSASESGDQRIFTKFQVNHRKCTGSICSFFGEDNYGSPHNSTGAGSVCSELQDASAPIMCGQDNKLSFLTLPNYSSSSCGRNFKAFRLADHHKTLSHFTNLNNTYPPLPTQEDRHCDVPSFFKLGQKSC